MIDLVAGRDFTPDGTIEAADVRDGDPCPRCEDGTLESARGIEMGHIFQLGRKYADALDLKVLDENGKLVTVTMGSYGIGPSRAVAAIAEDTLDEIGLCWPRNVSPYDVHVVAAGKDEAVFAAAERLVDDLSAQGIDVLYDDRVGKVSPGVKFKDAELIGVPTIVMVGQGVADGTIEVKDRRTGERTEVPVGEVVDHLVGVVRSVIDAVIFDWGGTLTAWHDIDFHAESMALAQAVVDADHDIEVSQQRLHAAGERHLGTVPRPPAELDVGRPVRRGRARARPGPADVLLRLLGAAHRHGRRRPADVGGAARRRGSRSACCPTRSGRGRSTRRSSSGTACAT